MYTAQLYKLQHHSTLVKSVRTQRTVLLYGKTFMKKAGIIVLINGLLSYIILHIH